ncbi:UNVERIFIED_CONTAM: Fatty-acid-binding protein 1 [Sesamum calycinum]|uniref:Fatty-acid-binding protein 1 n=1 Tax=Sesamum calycinum TaxID=2727403 RepID=A0AAW2MK91_9LAMI
MPTTTVNDVAEKTEMLEIDPNSSVALKSTTKDTGNKQEPERLEGENENKSVGEEEKKEQEEPIKEAMKEEDMPVEVEAKTVSFPVMLADGKRLNAIGLRKKSMIGVGINICLWIMGEASDDIKLTPGSVIEISRLPGYTLQQKDEVVSTVDSELLCRAFMYMYLGEDPFDKEAKEKFGTSLLSLF